MKTQARSVQRLVPLLLCAGLLSTVPHAHAQSPTAPAGDTRAGQIAVRQAEKAKALQPYAPNKAELWVKQLEEQLMGGGLKWHLFFESAYAGGGFTLGGGYRTFVGSYSTLDLRGSWTFTNYKRLEAEYRAPRLFDRRGVLSVIGGWREATQVGFYGIGTGNTSKDDRTNYSFEQPYLSGTLDVRPTRRLLLLSGGVELSEWKQGPGAGTYPSIEEVYTPETLPGLGASPTYVHTQGTAALDWRTSEGYTRSGGYYGVTAHSYADRDDTFSFRQVDYEAIQHLPLLRDAWVLSLRGRVQTTHADDDEVIPFFMLPSLGGGSTLRGFTSWRFRDRHSLLLSAEWRVLANSFLDTALFYDAGKVTSSRSDLDLNGLKNNFGIGVRVHGPAATPLRVELAKSNEGLAIVFSAKAAF
jgi:hypothetical protein